MELPQVISGVFQVFQNLICKNAIAIVGGQGEIKEVSCVNPNAVFPAHALHIHRIHIIAFHLPAPLAGQRQFRSIAAAE